MRLNARDSPPIRTPPAGDLDARIPKHRDKFNGAGHLQEMRIRAVFQAFGNTLLTELTSGPCSPLLACTRDDLTGRSPDFCASPPWYPPTKAPRRSAQ